MTSRCHRHSVSVSRVELKPSAVRSATDRFHPIWEKVKFSPVSLYVFMFGLQCCLNGLTATIASSNPKTKSLASFT